MLAERVVSEAPQAHILATSREALRVEGERVHLLYSLDCPPENTDLTAAETLKYPAAQLFMERATAGGYSAALSDIDAPIVATICRRLDGIALAIELAASSRRVSGIHGIAELLDNRFSLLWHGRRTALPRHQTLNAMLDWSYSLLSEYERVVLSRLSVLVGDFTLEAACLLVSETEIDGASATETLESLLAKSLISSIPVHGPTYYRLLDTTRAYARAKLAERGESNFSCVARQHANFFSRFLQHDEIVQSRFGERDLSGYMPRTLATCGRRSNGHSLTMAMPLSAWSSLPGRRRCSSDCLSLLEECDRCVRTGACVPRGRGPWHKTGDDPSGGPCVIFNVHQGKRRSGPRRDRARTCS